jgi:hypothetical protein
MEPRNLRRGDLVSMYPKCEDVNRCNAYVFGVDMNTITLRILPTTIATKICWQIDQDIKIAMFHGPKYFETVPENVWEEIYYIPDIEFPISGGYTSRITLNKEMTLKQILEYIYYFYNNGVFNRKPYHTMLDGLFLQKDGTTYLVCLGS